MIPLWMFPMAIATGNTFVLKPSEQDPLVTMRLAELALEAGIPKGVLNVIHGGVDAVNLICDHPDIKAVSFVGSHQGGHPRLQPRHPERQTRPVHDGRQEPRHRPARRPQAADPEQPAGRLLRRRRPALHGPAGGDPGGRGADLAAGSGGKGQDPVNAGVEPGTDIGPVVSCAALDRISGLIATRHGSAQLVLDGRNPSVPGYQDGNFVGPTIFSGVTTEMTIYREEIFGPVLCVVNAATLDEAIAFINANPNGNGTALFTCSGRRAALPGRDRRRPGGHQRANPGAGAVLSFSGSRASKLGDLGPYGKQVVLFYTQTKTITQRWFDEDDVGGAVNTTITLK